MMIKEYKILIWLAILFFVFGLYKILGALLYFSSLSPIHR
jgi:hypothetical protein